MSAWIDQIFNAREVTEGAVVRRNIADVEKHASMAELEHEVRLRGWHLLRIADQAVILCNNGAFSVIC